MSHKNSDLVSRRDIWVNNVHRYKIVFRFFLMVLFSLVLLPNVSIGQSRQLLEQKRQQLLRELKETNGRLEKTKKNKAATFEQYIALRSQVSNRQLLIENYTLEIVATDTAITRTADVIESLTSDQIRLKEDYAAMLRVAYRMKLNNNDLQFIFSSGSFNEAYRRWQYLRQYEHFRKNQAYLIEQTQFILENKIVNLETERAEKTKLLQAAQEQKETVDKEMKQMDSLLSRLKGDEKILLSELKKQQKAHDQLNNTIEKIIQEEVERKRRLARTSAGFSAPKATADADNLSDIFSQNKGNLPWPVTSGSITGHFGRQDHPTIKGIKITNNGIDIRTKKGAEVHAIFDGKVAGTQYIPGYQHTVIIQHGNYYSVYSNLDQIFVKRNDLIKNGQTVGKVGTEKPNLHFEIWQEKNRQNPVNWIRR